MSRVLITGSADGLGQMAARNLIAEGHDVTLHARSESRAEEALAAAPGAAGALHGDLASLAQTRDLAERANATGPFDAVIHNAGVYLDASRQETEDGYARVFQINALAPYVLTALIDQPKRLVYLSSGLHRGGSPELADVNWTERRWDAMGAYSESKLWDVVLAFAVARLWPGTLSNAIEPGWVATKMGGPGAPDDLEAGAVTQGWLAVSDDPSATVSGHYFFHQKERDAHGLASDPEIQDAFLAKCAELTGVAFPSAG
jgi:NAD(P)-dependent dehydrogenase (short-subunit alcohol dehydrogenase family)